VRFSAITNNAYTLLSN